MKSNQLLSFFPFFIFMVLSAGMIIWFTQISLSLTLGAALGFACVVSLSDPRKAYIVFLLLLPVHSLFFKLAPPKTHLLISDFVLCTLMISIIMECMTHDRKFIDPNPSTVFLISFFMLAMISLIWTSNMFHGCYEIVKLFICIFGFYATIYLLKDLNFFQISLGVFILVGSVMAITSIISTFYTNGWEYQIQLPASLEFHVKFWSKHLEMITSISGRGMGFSVPHDTAYFCNIAIFFVLGFILTLKKKRNLWILILIGLILLGGMLSTLTKSTVLALWCGIGFMLMTIIPLKKWLITAIIIVLCLTITVFFISRLHEIDMSLSYTKHQLDANKKGSSVESRSKIWKMGLRKLIKTSGIGYGAGGYNLKVDMPVPDGSHPSILFDFGIIGFFLWIMIYLQGFIFFITYLCLSQNEDGKRFMTAYIGGYIMLLISWVVTLHYDYVDIYFYLAIGYALTKAYGSEQQTSSTQFVFGEGEFTIIKSPIMVRI